MIRPNAGTGARREEGSSLLQLAVGIAILGLLVLAFSGTLRMTHHFATEQSEREVLARQGMLAMDRLTELLRRSESDSLVTEPFGLVMLPSDSMTEIEVRREVGVDDDWTSVHTEVTRILWRPGTREVVDQVDNDRDGLVDEGELVAIPAAGHEIVIAQNVPSQGLRIRDTGDGYVTVSLTIQRPITKGGQPARAKTFKARIPLQ